MAKRPGWANVAHQRHRAAQDALARSLPTYEIPVADSPHTAPGWRMLEEIYYCWKDVMYPWDPAVVLAIREFEPTAMPLTIRSSWQKMDRGNPQPPVTLVRHGIARIVRDALLPLHNFPGGIGMPRVHEPYLFSSFPGIHQKIAPNYMEVNHYDRDVRPYGYDLPGAYLPMNWDFYAVLRRDYENNRRHQDIARDFIQPKEEARDRSKQESDDYDTFVDAEITKYWSDPVSDVEWKNAIMRGPKTPEAPAQITVPGAPEISPTADAMTIGV